jgi:drug/metabolite transporter (DMT)-like permease
MRIGGKKVFAITLVMICIVLAALGQISFKKGLTQVGKIASMDELLKIKTISKILTSQFVLVGILMYVIAAGLWLAALSQLDVSFMYPLLSLAYVLTAIFAFVILRENIVLLRWIGIILVVTGCFLITRT